MRLVVTVLVAALGLGVAQQHAAAQPDDKANVALAQSLFDAGRSLMDERKYAEACAKFEESNRLDESAGTVLNIGKCLELQGKTASAWAMYKRTVVLGNATNKPRQVALAEQYLTAIEPRLARLSVSVEGDTPGLIVHAGESELGAASRGVPVVIDPGSVEIRAEAPGYEPWTTKVSLAEGRTEAITVPALVAKKKDDTVVVPPPVTPEEEDGVATGLLAGGIAASALAGVGFVVGTTFGVLTLDAASTAREDPSLCPEDRCTPAGLEHIEDAKVKATVATASLVTAGVAAAGAASLFIALHLRLPTSTKPAAIVVPQVGATMGVLVAGSW